MADTAQTKHLKRLDGYAKLANALACMSTAQLTQCIFDAEQIHHGIGGKTFKLELAERTIFIKKIPITALELEACNTMSTQNLFELPSCYQYGIGSAGFGAWRELASHRMTTNWVLSGQCPHFPIMYHWRLIAKTEEQNSSDKPLQSLDETIAYWEGNQKIANRLRALEASNHYICVFMEYFPDTAYEWLSKQLKKEAGTAYKSAASLLEQAIKTNDFMVSQKFLHMDGHFENILSDGEQIYYTDFGLALSGQFDLSPVEMNFLKNHGHYDSASTIVNLMHCIITSTNQHQNLHKTKVVDGIRTQHSEFDKNLKQFSKVLQDHLDGLTTTGCDKMDKLIKKYAQIAIVMDDFYCAAQKNKSTPYPCGKIEQQLPSAD